MSVTEQIIAVLDEEENYVTRLLRHFKRENTTDISPVAFTSEEAFEKYCEQNSVALLVCEENLYHHMKKVPDIPCILLAGSSVVREGEGPPVIYKYRTAQQVWEELLNYYRKMAVQPEMVRCGGSPKVYTVCSPFGGSGVSSLAYGFAKRLSKKKKVFYLSFDPFYLPEQSEYSEKNALTEVIYYLKQNTTYRDEKLNQLLWQRDRLDCLFGVGHWADLSEMSNREAKSLLEWIAGREKYDCIVIDSGVLCDAVSGCMQLSESIVMIKKNGKKEMQQEKEFLRQAGLRDSGFADKVIALETEEPEKLLQNLWLLTEEKDN